MKFSFKALLVLAAAASSSPASADTALRSDRWEVGQSPQFGYLFAAVRAEDSKDLLVVTCKPQEYVVFISFWPNGEHSRSDRERSVALSFDAGTPISQTLKTVKTSDGYMGFSLYDEDPAYQPVIDKLMAFHDVDLTIIESGRALGHQRFSLDNAVHAIATVLRDCGH